MAEIKALLSYEDALRLAPETQAKYRAYRLRGEGEKGMTEVVEQVQKAVAAAFGLDEQVGLEAMRCAEAIVESRPAAEGGGASGLAEVVRLSLYRRHNRCVDGPLIEGSAAPLEVPLFAVSDSAKAKVQQQQAQAQAQEEQEQEQGAAARKDPSASSFPATTVGDLLFGGGGGVGGGSGGRGGGAANRALVLVAGSYT